MAFERIELNICPAGDMPVFHCSQYDVGRPIIIDLKNGDDAFSPTAGTTFELHCRKVDDNIVTLDTYEVDGNTLTFTSTEQLCACPGDNLCEVAIYLDELCMGTLNFMLHVEPDPLAGGLESETQIHDLYEQVEEITQQVIGDDYYNKTEVDDLLDDKADKATTYTKTEVDTALNLKADKSTTYTKTETNNLLAGKADASDTYSKAQVDSKLSLKADKATTYTKDETDSLLSYKANASNVYTRSQTDNLLLAKADKLTTYTKTQVDDALALKANSDDLATVATTGDYDDLLNKPSIPAAQVQSDYSQSDNTKIDYIKNKPDLSIYTTQEDIILVTGTENEVPYLFIPTPDNVGNKCLDKLVGGTVAFNQLVNKANFTNTTKEDYTVVDNGDGSLTITIINTLASNQIFYTVVDNVSNYLKVPNNHKFVILDDNYNAEKYNYRNGHNGTNYSSLMSIQNDSDGYILLGVCLLSGLTPQTITIKPQVVDLTQMFGSAIADYIYNLESGTAGAGVAWLKSHGYLTKPYYDYNAGELVSVKTSKHVMRDSGNNIIGEYDLSGSRLVHRNFGVVDLGSLNWGEYGSTYNITQYYTTELDKLAASSAGMVCSRFVNVYPAGGAWTCYVVASTTSSGRTYFRTPKDYYDSPSAFKAAMNGVYLIYELAEPFDETVLNPELHGIPKLDANNNLYYDGDTCSDFTNPQTVVPGGTEEYVDGRSIEIPVGHDTIYSKKTSYRYW